MAILACPDAVFASPGPLRQPPSKAPDPCGSPQQPAPAAPVAVDPTAVPPPFGPETSDAIIRAMLDQCERLRDRVAIVDPPKELQTPNFSELTLRFARTSLGFALSRQAQTASRSITDWRARFDSPFGALYYPWLSVPDPLEVEGQNRLVPPSGHIAGVYAQTDLLYGVQRPPANVAIEDLTDVAVDVTAAQQRALEPRWSQCPAFVSGPGHQGLGGQVARVF